MDDASRALSSLRKGVAEFCVLAELRHTPTYGLELARLLTAQGLIAGPGTLYPMLARLEANGLLTPEWEQVGQGRPRKYYSVTARGLEELDVFEASWKPLVEAVDRTLRGES